MMGLPYVSGEELASLLPFPLLIESLATAFRAGSIKAPPRQHFSIGEDRDWLIMPAWAARGEPGMDFGAKLVSVFPGNGARGLDTINGVYVLFDGETGRPTALFDAVELTARRTAATSALVAKHLTPQTVAVHLIVGTGKLVSYLAEAHASVRKPKQIQIWGRDHLKATLAADRVRSSLGIPTSAVGDLTLAVRRADLISTATRSQEPLVKGAWLKPGCHLDLVGGFRPDMREVDDVAIDQSCVVVDTLEGALSEAGDIIQPLERGILQQNDLLTLTDLVVGESSGRIDREEITVFKSVGHAVEDLATARLALSCISGEGVSEVSRGRKK